ncbi:MAG: hypothetical protein KF757_03520 [Phycisphaeraceae bacterium]|nr:hypothetical protein [Phycisphaeraceae bacterium]MCW5763073.1 hypothetical protein [Phycisphaeraceae bacterium]
MVKSCARSLTCAAFVALAPFAGAQVIETAWNQPDGDRWMYPFNGTPGSRISAPTFATPNLPEFDNRDGQFILLFTTTGRVPTGLPLSSYRVISARVTATVANDRQFFYDPTFDAVNTYRDENDPLYTSDNDIGRPIEIYPVGYRDGFSLANFTETSPYNVVGNPFIDASDIRVAFAAAVDANGNAIDISNNVRDGFEVSSLAIGLADLPAGALVPADTTFTFDLTLCNPQTQRYFAEALTAGKLNLVISSLHGATFDPDIGPGDPLYPDFYTRDNPIAAFFGLAPTLELVIRVGSAGDYNADGIRDFFDVQAFLADLSNQNPRADLVPDCSFDFFDVQRFLSEFSQ